MERHERIIEELRGVIAGLPAERIEGFIIDKANEDENFRDELMLRFANDGNEIEYARNIVQRAVQVAMRDKNFVEYKDSYTAMSGADTVLEIADGFGAERALTRLKICAVVLDEMLILDQNSNADDIWLATNRAIDCIRKTVSDLPKDFKDRGAVIDLLLSFAQNDDWEDWRGDFLLACSSLIGD